MRALSCDEPGKLSIIQRDEPHPAGNEVLVRIRHVGVCGTDYHIFHGNQPYLSYPRVIGHELGAEVVSAPAGSALRTGQIVSIMPTIYCGHCRACRMGKTTRRSSTIGGTARQSKSSDTEPSGSVRAGASPNPQLSGLL